MRASLVAIALALSACGGIVESRFDVGRLSADAAGDARATTDGGSVVDPPSDAGDELAVEASSGDAGDGDGFLNCYWADAGERACDRDLIRCDPTNRPSYACDDLGEDFWCCSAHYPDGGLR